MARGLLSLGNLVGAPRPTWVGDSSCWIDSIEDISDCVYITIYGGLSSIQCSARVYFLQFFSVANAPIEEEILGLMARVGRNRVFITHSYPSDGCDLVSMDLRDRVALLPTPVAEPVSGDSTEKTVLFHPSRNTLHSLISDGGQMLNFVRRALRRDPCLTFETVSGTYESYNAQAIWALPSFRDAFDDLRSQVVVHPPLNYIEMQRVYARTRLVVCPSGYGGPPLESARHGIPVIALERDCSLFTATYTPGFPELPRLKADGTLVEILERLLYDPVYARCVGDAGRRYVAEHFGYAAFGRALHGILEHL